ncbi:IS30 family transposase [Akkermansiaceae bacterium]|nr:IS30 family transposase [Akkermansiaceae bacterium]
MNHFKHLTRHDRYTIEAMLRNPHSQAEIAATLQVDPATISREIRRDGMTRHSYCTNRAQAHCESSRPPSPTAKSADLWEIVDCYLSKQQWSPEEISGYLAKNTQHRVSHEAIYLHVYEEKSTGGTLYTHLRQSHRKRKRRRNTKDKRGTLKHRISIDDRPAIVEKKTRLGDLEMDTVIGLTGGAVLVTIVDRVSKYTFMGLSPSKHAAEVGAVIYDLLKGFKEVIKTATYDNGKEFAYHHILNDLLKIDSYFAHPYSSWERGLNENTNGLIRQYFPKKSDLTKLTPADVLRVQDLLNSRPRKTLDYATPNDIFLDQRSVALPS